ncbi:MAG: hypothetical protein ACK4TN_03135, partial [Brevinematales bacterium]
MRGFICWFCWVFWGIISLSQVYGFSTGVALLDNWRYTYGDNPLYAKEDYQEQGWSVVQFPTTTFVFEGEKEPYTWL